MFALTAASALAGCEQTAATPTVVYDRVTLNAKYQAVTDMVKMPVCSTSPQCSSVGIGAKPCGGPWRYLVYSKVNVNAQELQRRVDDLFAFEREYNRRNGIASDCSVARAATPGCVDGFCIDLNA
ncbi:MAG: hypothetical protein ACRDF6_08180, partial [bacterium]